MFFGSLPIKMLAFHMRKCLVTGCCCTGLLMLFHTKNKNKNQFTAINQRSENIHITELTINQTDSHTNNIQQRETSVKITGDKERRQINEWCCFLLRKNFTNILKISCNLYNNNHCRLQPLYRSTCVS